jgi:hypothetical protein
MRKIAGPGHVSNEFADYDAITNPLGTFVTAAWGNDVQNELVGIQDEMGIAEAAGSNKYILAAIRGIATEAAFFPGSLHHIAGVKKSPAGFDKDSPGSYFPAICLDPIETSLDIDAAHWPLLVPVLRAAKMIYLEGLAGESADYELTGWAVTGGTATLTLANNAANNQLLAVIAEHFLAIADYPVVYLPRAISAIDAGDYRITGADPVAREIEFATAAGNGSGATSERAQIFPHRIPGSATQARIYGARGMALMSAGWGGHMAGGLRRSYMQQITGELSTEGAHTPFVSVSSSGALRSKSKASTGYSGASGVNRPATITLDSADSPGARTGPETEPRSLTAHLYLGGGRYVP